MFLGSSGAACGAAAKDAGEPSAGWGAGKGTGALEACCAAKDDDEGCSAARLNVLDGPDRGAFGGGDENDVEKPPLGGAGVGPEENELPNGSC